MASLLSTNQVAGKDNAIYEAYYLQMDPKGLGIIEAMDAAKFLKKSGLSDVVLSRIWDLSDPKGKGCLDKSGFFVALKLVALAQAGSDVNMRNIYMGTEHPPKVGEFPKINPQTVQSLPVTSTGWSMKPGDKMRYEKLFESLQPENGMIAGNKVKGVLMESKLPLETLGKIWDLADQDKDGNLDQHEFAVAMHLVYQALDKRAVPTSLPTELLKTKPGDGIGNIIETSVNGSFVPNFPTDIAPPPVPPLPSITANTARPSPPPFKTPSIPFTPADSTLSIINQNAPTYDWVVNPADRERFASFFRQSDKDKDGLVSGHEVKHIFLQSGVPQNCLAHIWALCDTNQSGKLTMEQFALAMFFVEQKKKGIEPPEVLAPNMIPPSLRGPIVTEESVPKYSNPELEMISKEIDDLACERRQLETDIAQKEADIRIKSGEVRSLQSELDTLVATLKQLENQKGEAQKRLDDLKNQKVEISDEFACVNIQVEETRAQIIKIRDQCQNQESTINEQEEELHSKKSELQKLKDEESALEKEYEANHRELDSLTKQLQATQLQISQVKAMVTQLLETQRQMNDALLLCKAAIDANDACLVSDYSLKMEPDLMEAKQALKKQSEQSKIDPVKDCDDFGSRGVFEMISHQDGNGIETDSFINFNGNRASNFEYSFANTTISEFDDAFGSTSLTTSCTKDPFSSHAVDPFGCKATNSIIPESGKDDFGSDPFAILHAPTSIIQASSSGNSQKFGPPPRPESPSPALPPKKSKQPPPRPAPPRPVQAPIRMSPATTEKSGFADFANFDKIPSVMPLSNPMPLAPTNQNDPFSRQGTREVNKNNGNWLQTTVKDFAEDPFKDYRYEDPYNIDDPFRENDEDRCSEGVFSHSSTKDNFAEKSSQENLKADLHSDSKEKPRNVKASANLANVDNEKNAVFDISNNEAIKVATHYDFFDAFDDNFKKFGTRSMSSSRFVDPFGSANLTQAAAKSSKLNAFNDNFEDDFNKINITDRNENIQTTYSNFENVSSKRSNLDDAFVTSVSEKTLNVSKAHATKRNTISSEVKNCASAKVPDKFADDYSGGDTFDEDLKKALERSLVSQ